MPKGTLRVRIVGDNRGLKKSLDDSGSLVGRFAKGFGRASIAAVKWGTGTAIATGAVGIKLGTLAGQLDSMESKARTVFGNQIKRVRRWAKANSEAMGLTNTELTGLSANFADLLIPMGFTRKQAANMSMDVVGLSGALSEWSGGQRSAAEVSEILAKAMLGERDSLKELGISILDADVKARLAKKGQEDLTGAALEQAKALATQELIFEKSTDAQERYAKGGVGVIRAQNRARVAFKNLRDELARRLAPTFEKVANWAADKIPKALDKIKGWWDRNGPTVKKWAGRIAAALRNLAHWAGNVWKFLSDAFQRAKPFLLAMALAVATAINAVIHGINALIRAQNFLSGSKIKTIGTIDTSGMERAFAQALVDNVSSKKPASSKRRGGASSGAGGSGQAERFHSGGIVGGSPGHEVPIIARGGEPIFESGNQLMGMVRAAVREALGAIVIQLDGRAVGRVMDKRLGGALRT